jgi:hypothetical protein
LRKNHIRATRTLPPGNIPHRRPANHFFWLSILDPPPARILSAARAVRMPNRLFATRAFRRDAQLFIAFFIAIHLAMQSP